MATDSTAVQPAPPRLWQLPTFLAGLAAFLGVWQGWINVSARDVSETFLDNLGALRAASEKLNPERDELKSLLQATTRDADAFPEYAALADYTIGSGYVRLAEITAEPSEALTSWTLARQHFEKVKAEQLPDAMDAARFSFRAAKARAATMPANATYGEIDLTRSLIMKAPLGEPLGEANRLSADLSLRLNPPDATGAKSLLTSYVAESGFATPPASIARAKMKLSEVCLLLGEPEKAREWLELIKDAPPDVMLSRSAQLARLLMADGKWSAAAKEWDAVRTASGAPPAQKLKAAYFLAECRTKSDPPDRLAAMKLYEEASTSDGPEGPASAVRLAELLLQTEDAAKHLEAARLLIATATRLAGQNGYANQLLPVHDARGAFELALRVLQADGAFEAAVQVVDAYPAIAAIGRDREKRAELMIAWGTSLKKMGGAFQPKFTAAADDYLELATAQSLPEGKVELLRRAAATYRLAGNATAAVSALEQMVKMPELPEAVAGSVWLEYVESLVAAKRPPDEVIHAINKAMASSGTASITARYRLARSLLDTQNAQLAPLGMALLEQVAGQSSIPPADATTHELALVELAHEYIRRGAFADAESRLSVQLSRYPNGPEAGLAKLLKGVCLLQLASKKNPTDPDNANAPKLRGDALKLFQEVVDDVDRREKAGPVPDRDVWLRLQTSLRICQTYLQLGEPDRVLSAAAPVVQRHRGTVEELIVLSLMYHAQKQKNQVGLALSIRDRMKEVFEELKKKPGAFKAPNGEYSQTYWETVWFSEVK